MSLLPVTWVDGWPIMGRVLPEKIGTMAWAGLMPFCSGEKLTIRRSDDFDDAALAPQWQWNYQPRAEMFSLTERPGWLRLKAFRPLEENRLLKAGNTLTQRTFRKTENEVVVKMDISRMTDGQKAGLCHFSSSHAALGVVKEGGRCFLEYRRDDRVSRGIPLEASCIWLKSEWGLDGLSRFSYSLDGDHFLPCGAPYPLAWGNYRGDRVGIYSFNDLSDTGWVDVDYLHYR